MELILTPLLVKNTSTLETEQMGHSRFDQAQNFMLLKWNVNSTKVEVQLL